MSKLDARIRFLFLISFSVALYVNSYTILIILLIVLFFIYFGTKSNHTSYSLYFNLMSYTCLVLGGIIIGINYYNNIPILNGTESVLNILIVSYSSIIFFATTSFVDFFLIMKSFRVPKFLSEAFFSAFRFFSVVTKEFNNIILAQKSKGLNVNKGIKGFEKMPQIILFTLLPLMNILLHKLEILYISREMREIDVLRNYNTLSFQFSKYNVAGLLSVVALILLPFFF